tara:strand:- start:28337 stop:28594 length:258 start_codon:yes stop_codon:yes gene_type:complete
MNIEEIMQRESMKFQELLKVIHCLSYLEFVQIFGEHEAEYFWDKFREVKTFEFICYLDFENVEALYKFAQEKMRKFKEKQQQRGF